MKFTYTPDGGDPRSWDFRPGKMLNVEAEECERLFGDTFQVFGQAFMSGSMKAYHVLLYVFLHRNSPGLKYEQVQFTNDEISVDFDPDEHLRIVEELERNYDSLSEEQRLALATLKSTMPSVPEPQDGDDPKAGVSFYQPSDNGGNSSSAITSGGPHGTSTA